MNSQKKYLRIYSEQFMLNTYNLYVCKTFSFDRNFSRAR